MGYLCIVGHKLRFFLNVHHVPFKKKGLLMLKKKERRKPESAVLNGVLISV